MAPAKTPQPRAQRRLIAKKRALTTGLTGVSVEGLARQGAKGRTLPEMSRRLIRALDRDELKLLAVPEEACGVSGVKARVLLRVAKEGVRDGHAEGALNTELASIRVEAHGRPEEWIANERPTDVGGDT